MCFCTSQWIFCCSQLLDSFATTTVSLLTRRHFNTKLPSTQLQAQSQNKTKTNDIQVPCPSGWWCGGARPHRGFPSGLECEPPTHWLCHPHEGLPEARMFGRYQRSWQPRNSRPRSCQQCCPLQLKSITNQKEEAFSWSQLIVLQARNPFFQPTMEKPFLKTQDNSQKRSASLTRRTALSTLKLVTTKSIAWCLAKGQPEVILPSSLIQIIWNQLSRTAGMQALQTCRPKSGDDTD